MHDKIIFSYFKTPYGELLVGSYEDKLCICDWRYRKMRTAIDTRINKYLNSEYIEGNSNTIEETKKQLTEYFNEERKKFNLDVLLVGTDFQKKIWKTLIEIPYGKTESYLSLAKSINNEKAVRAVASANGANAISIIVPCHRIIGSNGSLVGYAGSLKTKNMLLEIENPLKEKQLKLF